MVGFVVVTVLLWWVGGLVGEGDVMGAQRLIPKEDVYPLSRDLAEIIGAST